MSLGNDRLLDKDFQKNLSRGTGRPQVTRLLRGMPAWMWSALTFKSKIILTVVSGEIKRREVELDHQVIIIIINRFYIALFSALEQTHCARMWSTWVNSFYSAFLNIHRSGVLTALAWLVPQESAARESQSRRVLCTPYNHAPCHFMQSHLRKVYACLDVTCHLLFWQNDRGLLRATAVTRGWNGYRNKSQHRKLTLEKKILPPLQQGFEPATLQSWVRRSNHWAIPAPHYIQVSPEETMNREEELHHQVSPEEIMNREEELDHQVSPEETMNREEELDHQVSPEETMNREEELDHQVSPEETMNREEELDHQVSPEQIMNREEELGCGSWTSFTSGCSSTAVQRTLSLWLCPARQLKQQLHCALVAAQWRGDTALTLPLCWWQSMVSPTFFGRYLRSSLHSFKLSPPPPQPPIPNKQPRFCGHKATRSTAVTGWKCCNHDGSMVMSVIEKTLVRGTPSKGRCLWHGWKAKGSDLPHCHKTGWLQRDVPPEECPGRSRSLHSRSHTVPQK